MISNYLPGLAYVLSLSLGMVILDGVVSTINPTLSLLITSSFAVLFFHIATKTKLKALYQRCWQSRRLWFSTNLAGLVIWIGTYYAVKWVGATAMLFLYFLSLVAAQYTKELIAQKDISWNIVNIIIPITLMAIYYGLHHHTQGEKLGFLVGIIAGTSCMVYNHYSTSFASSAKLTTLDVLAVRFYMILFSLPFLITNDMFTEVHIIDIMQLLLVSIFTFIIPLYMYQKSLTLLPIRKHTMVVTSSPLAAFLLQGLILHEWSLLMLSMCLLTLFFLVISLWLFQKQ